MNLDKLPFKTARQLAVLIDSYFVAIEGLHHNEEKLSKTGLPEIVKIYDRDPEPATFTGLALYLGYGSLQAFEDYGNHGKFARLINRARLRIEAAYEKKLHNQPATGAIFALKRMGWDKQGTDNCMNKDQEPKPLKLEIIDSGPKLAASEKEVVIEFF